MSQNKGGHPTDEQRIAAWIAKNPTETFLSRDVAKALGLGTKRVGGVLRYMKEVEISGRITGEGLTTIWRKVPA